MSDDPHPATEEPAAENPFALLPRPAYQFRSLPIEYRWEATRRHPYYLTYWSSALRHQQDAPIEDLRELVLRPMAVGILAVIGVSGAEIPPETNFADIETESLERAGMAGLIHPVSNRGLFALLITALPRETLAQLGMLLTERFADGDDADLQKLQALFDLNKRTDPGLDEFVDEFIVSVAPTASGRAIADDLHTQLDRWRAQREVSEQRDRSDKYAEYLEVWDLREGWAEGRYDNSQELLLDEVATQLDERLSTIKNRYRSAFELITGHPYSPRLWLQVFGPDKLSPLLTTIVGRVSSRRPLRSPVRRDVPESVITPVGVSEGFVNDQSVVEDNRDAADLLMDLEALMEKGLTNQDFADRYNLDADQLELLQTLRERFEEQ